jgi:hypothetical protein
MAHPGDIRVQRKWLVACKIQERNRSLANNTFVPLTRVSQGVISFSGHLTVISLKRADTSDTGQR